MVYRGAIFEIESLIRKCWWPDPVEDSAAHLLSSSLWCHLTCGPITSSLHPWYCAGPVSCPFWLFTILILLFVYTVVINESQRHSELGDGVLDYRSHHQHATTQEAKQKTLTVIFQDSANLMNVREKKGKGKSDMYSKGNRNNEKMKQKCLLNFTSSSV